MTIIRTCGKHAQELCKCHEILINKIKEILLFDATWEDGIEPCYECGHEDRIRELFNYIRDDQKHSVEITQSNSALKVEEKKEEQAYSEILAVLKKYKNICAYDVDSMESLAKKHLFGIELKEKYGFNIDPQNIQSLSWNSFGEYMSVGQWGKKHNRTISWSDDDNQPENELLLQISFPTGAYIFRDNLDDDCPTDFFKEFFKELKTYNPKYTDTNNNKLYFSMSNAGKMFNEFPVILKKYYELNKIDSKKREIKKLEEQLGKLKGATQ